MKLVKESILKGPSHQEILNKMEKENNLDKLKDVFLEYGVDKQNIDKEIF